MGQEEDGETGQEHKSTPMQISNLDLELNKLCVITQCAFYSNNEENAKWNYLYNSHKMYYTDFKLTVSLFLLHLLPVSWSELAEDLQLGQNVDLDSQ